MVNIILWLGSARARGARLLISLSEFFFLANRCRGQPPRQRQFAYQCLMTNCDAEGVVSRSVERLQQHYDRFHSSPRSHHVASGALAAPAVALAIETGWNINTVAQHTRDSLDHSMIHGVTSPRKSTSTQSISDDGDNSINVTADEPANMNDRTCPTCNRHFRRAPNLRRHLRSHDPTERVYHCHVPGCAYKGSYRQDKLADHIKKRHA